MFQETLEYIIKKNSSDLIYLGKIYHTLIFNNIDKKYHSIFQNRNIKPIIPEQLSSRYELEAYMKSYIYSGKKPFIDMSNQLKLHGDRLQITPKPSVPHSSHIILETLKSALYLPLKIDVDIILMMQFIITSKLDFFNDNEILKLEYLEVIEILDNIYLISICEDDATATILKNFLIDLTIRWLNTFSSYHDKNPEETISIVIERNFRRFVDAILRNQDPFFLIHLFDRVYVHFEKLLIKTLTNYDLAKPIFEKLLTPSQGLKNFQTLASILKFIPETSQLQSIIDAFISTCFVKVSQDENIRLEGLNQIFNFFKILFRSFPQKRVTDKPNFLTKFSADTFTIIEAWTNGLIKHGHMNYLIWLNKDFKPQKNFEFISKYRAQFLICLIENTEALLPQKSLLSTFWLTKLTYVPHVIQNLLYNEPHHRDKKLVFFEVMQSYLDKSDSIFNQLIIKLGARCNSQPNSRLPNPKSMKKDLLKFTKFNQKDPVAEFLYRGLMHALQNTPNIKDNSVLLLHIAGNDDLLIEDGIHFTSNPYYKRLHANVIRSVWNLEQRYFAHNTSLIRDLENLRNQVVIYLETKARSPDIDLSRLGYQASLWFMNLLPNFPPSETLSLTTEDAFLLVWKAMSDTVLQGDRDRDSEARLERLRMSLLKKVLFIKSLRHVATPSDLACLAMNGFVYLLSEIHPDVTISKFINLDLSPLIHKVFNLYFESIARIEQELIILRSYKLLLSQKAQKTSTFLECFGASAKRSCKTELRLSELDKKTLQRKFINHYQADIDAGYVTSYTIAQWMLKPWPLANFASVDRVLSQGLDEALLNELEYNFKLKQLPQTQKLPISLKRSINDHVPAGLTLLASLAIQKNVSHAPLSDPLSTAIISTPRPLKNFRFPH